MLKSYEDGCIVLMNPANYHSSVLPFCPAYSFQLIKFAVSTKRMPSTKVLFIFVFERIWYLRHIFQEMAQFELPKGTGHVRRRPFLPSEDLAIIDSIPRSKRGCHSYYRDMERYGVCPLSFS